MEAPRSYRAHFVFIPLMAQGHVIPMFDLARFLSRRGDVLVTFASTPSIVSRLLHTLSLSPSPSIHLITLPFPSQDVGLPPLCDALDVIPDITAGAIFMNSLQRLLEPPLRRLLLDRNPQIPTSLISDFCHPWTHHVSQELGLRRYVFYSLCGFTLTCHCILSRHYESHAIHDDDKDKPFVIPGLHHSIKVTRAQAPGFFPGDSAKQLRMEAEEAEASADGIIVNTFAEMEPIYVESYEREMGTKVWPVGPLSLFRKEASDLSSRGARSAVSVDKVVAWLDSQKPKSVVYLCLGTLTRVKKRQMMEIKLGLESCGSPFIWATRGEVEVEEGEGEGDGDVLFLMGRRGMVIRGWAPQVLILSHAAVGAFVTHCGWNSVVEGMAAGVPMVTWPWFSEQFLNERMVVEVVQTGVEVEVGAKEPREWWREEQEERVVGREELAGALRKAMGGGEEAEERRRRARELAERAKAAVAEEGSSWANVAALVEEVAATGRHGGGGA